MIKNKFISRLFALSGIIAFPCVSMAQRDLPDKIQLNTITTAVPFLLITPDARSGALGDAGVALVPDANSIHWNPSKLAFVEDEAAFSFTYSPWLRSLVGDISLSYVSGYKRLNEQSTIGASLRYFSLGEINWTDINGVSQGTFKPNEFAFDVAYATKLSDQFSFGMALRYINSNLTSGIPVEGQSTKPGRSVAADVSAYYVNDDVQIGDKDAIFRAGINISNIGAKMTYTETADPDFIPTNLKIGQATTFLLDEYNEITILTDINKLLVPTPPIYGLDNDTIIAGRDPENVSVASGIFGSFSDAPGFDDNNDGVIDDGSVMTEELREISYSVGMEYWYDQQFAVRLGYFYEHPTKGNRQYFTMGIGLKLNVFGLDLSYLVGGGQQNPLSNTLRASIKFDFDAFKAQNEE